MESMNTSKVLCSSSPYDLTSIQRAQAVISDQSSDTIVLYSSLPPPSSTKKVKRGVKSLMTVHSLQLTTLEKGDETKILSPRIMEKRQRLLILDPLGFPSRLSML